MTERLEEGLEVFLKVCDAIAYAHHRGVIHRDLKPDNIMLIQRGRERDFVKLLDFGIAKLTGDQGSVSKHQTRTGLVIGTPSYMSPEQCEGKGNIDWRSDVYSLGVCLYEMLAGRCPFTADGFGEILVAHLTKQVPLPSTIRHDIPPGIESVVMHALEKNRNNRFQSMDEFAAALADADAHMAVWGSPSGRTAEEMPMPPPPPARGTGGHAPIRATGAMPPIRATGAHKPITGQGARPPTGATAVIEGTKPTTLSGSAGEVAGGEAPRTGGRGLLFGGVGGGLAAASLAVYFLVLHKPPPPKPVVQPVVAQPEKPKDEFTHIAVDSTPRGAKAYRAGIADPIGMTPFELKVKKGEPEFDLLLKLDGFEDQTKTVTTERDHDMLIALGKSAATSVAVAAPPSSHHSSGKSGKKNDSGGFKPVGDKKKDKDGTLEPTF
jgi:hypothetical protein